MGFFDWIKDRVGDVIKIGAATVSAPIRVGQDLLEKIPVVGKPIAEVTRAPVRAVEKLGEGSYWLYSKAVSRPLSTLVQAAGESGLGAFVTPGAAVSRAVGITSNLSKFKSGSEFQKALGVEPGRWDNLLRGSTWETSWDRAKHISPGQASVLAFNNMDAPTVRAQRIRAFVDHKGNIIADDGSGKMPMGAREDWVTVPEHKLDLDDPKDIKEYFSYGPQKFASGAADFAVNWYADPTVGVLKGAKAAAALKHVKAPKGQVAGFPIKDPKTGQAIEGKQIGPEDFQAAVDSRPVESMIKWTQGKNAAQIMELDSVKKSYNGPLLADALARAKDDASKKDLLRLSLGDASAMDALRVRDGDLAASLEYTRGRYSSISNNLASLTPNSPAWDIANSAIAKYQDDINRLERESGEISNQMALYRTVDDLHAGVVTRGAATARAAFKYADKNPKPFHHVIHNNFYSRPLRIVRSLGDKHPNGWVDLNATDSYREVQAWAQKIPGISREERQQWVSDYMAQSDKVSRANYLQAFEQRAVQKMAEKHGVDPTDAVDFYHEYSKARNKASGGAVAAGGRDQAFSAARYEKDGQLIRVDDFGDVGEGISIHPNLRTKLESSHPMMDLDFMDRAIKVHGKTFGTLRKGLYAGEDFATALGDAFNQSWKLGVLMRLGYPIRAISDPLLGQAARFGAVGLISSMTEGLGRMARNNMKFIPGEADKFHTEAYTKIIGDIDADLAWLKKSRPDDTARISYLEGEKVKMQEKMAAGSHLPSRTRAGDMPFQVHGATFPGAFQGTEGNLYRSLSSADAHNAQLFKDYTGTAHGAMRQGNWEILQAAKDPQAHLNAWHHDVMNQIGQDALARQIVEGKSKEEVVRWFSTKEGQLYKKDLPWAGGDPEDMFFRVRAEVDHYLPTHTPELRPMVLDGTLTPDDLRRMVPEGVRPDVHSQQLETSMGKGYVAYKMGDFADKFYKYMATLPSDILERHPLFNRLYKGHVTRLTDQLAAQDRKVLGSEINSIAHSARERALKDLKRYSFDVTHKSEIAHGLRFAFPFIAASQEQLTRWARITYDAPQTIGRFGQTITTPERLGMVTDLNGNEVSPLGYAIDPATGEKRLVPESERRITFQLPGPLKGLSGGGDFIIPKKSPNIILQGDPWFNPGAGPLVQMPLNEIAKEKPDLAKMLKDTGMLPLGTREDSLSLALPNVIQKWQGSDEGSDAFQRQLATVMQAETYKYNIGERATPPTWKEVTGKAQNYFAFRASMAFLMPFSVDKKDPYQFYRDQFKNMQAQDPMNADMAFYMRYGADLFVFAGKMSKSPIGGGAPTQERAAAFKRYQGIIGNLDPDFQELGSLIIGPEGKGPFSPEAYTYELNTLIGSGSDQHLREKMTAREIMEDNKRRQGWVVYNDWMHYIESGAFRGGTTNLPSDTAAAKKQIVNMLANPESSYYNENWAADYKTLDLGKYDRLMPHLESISKEPSLQHRGDIQVLNAYVEGRKQFVSILQQRSTEPVYTKTGRISKRKASASMTSKANADIRQAWEEYVTQLVESNTDFGDLYHRWLSRDFGLDEFIED